MNKRQLLSVALAAVLAAPGRGVGAQSKAAAPVPAAGTASEAALREAIADFEAAWNRHDVKAWLALMTEDVWFTAADDFYERMKGKKAVKTSFEYDVKNTDLRWEIKRLRIKPDGGASVVLRHTALLPPKVDGKYKREDVSDPSLARWRVEKGKWRMYFFTSYKGFALSEMKKEGLEP